MRRWLDQRTDAALFAASVGNAPSLVDVIKTVHPKPGSRERERLRTVVFPEHSDLAIAVAERIIELLNDPKRARAMGERGRSFVAERFSCDQHLQNTLELYDELLSTPKSAPSRIGHEWRLNE